MKLSTTGLRALYLMGLVLVAAPASAGTSFGFGLSYGENNGGLYAPAYGAPIYGYGGAASSFGAIGGACQNVQLVPVCGGGCGGGVAMNPGIYGPGAFPGPGVGLPGPGFPGPMPASLPPIPQNLSVQGMMSPVVAPPSPPGWGSGYASYPGPWAAPGNCSACGMGLSPQAVYAVNQPILPFPGGPMSSVGLSAGVGYNSGSSSGIITVGDRNEWEKDDTAGIVWATAMGLGMQATNVYPVTCMRNSPTVIAPSFYSTGDRSLGFVERAHSTP